MNSSCLVEIFKYCSIHSSNWFIFLIIYSFQWHNIIVVDSPFIKSHNKHYTWDNIIFYKMFQSSFSLPDIGLVIIMYNYWKKLSVQDCVDMKHNGGALQDCNLKQYFVVPPEVEPLLEHDVADCIIIILLLPWLISYPFIYQKINSVQ